MEKKNSCAGAGFSTILWGILAILLCAVPCVWADWYYQNGTWFLENTEDPCDIKETISGNLSVKNATANLLTGASVSQSIYVQTGGTLNMYAGTIGMGWFISIGLNAAGVTIYGTGFATDGTSLDYGEWTPPDGSAVLTGNYADGSTINLWIMSNIPIKLAAPAKEVEIDIKPGSYPNSLNINGHGVIPVAILGSADFDVTQIDLSTLRFAGLEVRVKGNGAPQCSIKDVSGDFTNPEGAPDGYQDLVCQFVDNPDTWLPGEGVAKLMGNLLDGTPIEGTDEIIIVRATE